MLLDDQLALPGGPRLAVRGAAGPGRPFLLVHGLASNARLWDGVARRLAASGHEVLAVDLRGHGRSEETPDGYDTATAADDLAALIALKGWGGPRAPIAVGQSWGGNVVLTLAAVHGGVAGLGLVDGGWIHLADRFPTFDGCWEVLAPPRFDGLTRADLEQRSRGWHADWPDEGRLGSLANFADLPDGTVRPHLSRAHHRSIVHSLWQDDPSALYPRVEVPTVLMAAVGEIPSGSTPVTRAAEAIGDAEVIWYVGAHHDLHAQQPERCARDLLALAARVDGAVGTVEAHRASDAVAASGPDRARRSDQAGGTDLANGTGRVNGTDRASEDGASRTDGAGPSVPRSTRSGTDAVPRTT